MKRRRKRPKDPIEGPAQLEAPSGYGDGSDDVRPTGPWRSRVRFSAGGFAYRPGEVLVHRSVADLAEQSLNTLLLDAGGSPVQRVEGPVAVDFVRLRGGFEVPTAIGHLHSMGVSAQVNHVVFAIHCCPPHPARWRRHEGTPFHGTPFHGTPFHGTPFHGTSFHGTPFHGTAGTGCGCGRCCCCTGGSHQGTPFHGTPFHGTPFHGTADPSPFQSPGNQASGARRSSARPADAPGQEAHAVDGPVTITILDTGLAEAFQPQALQEMTVEARGGDRPDEDGDGYLDPVSGHGTFIAGIIEQRAPGCALEVIEVLATQGDGDEAEISAVLTELAERDEPPQLVNLSFGAYAPLGMGVLARAVSRLQDAGTIVVAAAGNDGTCVPMYPAALPGVVSVGALDRDGEAAHFTNYGPWVRASTLGVDVVSMFFEGYDGADPPVEGSDPDRFQGWARWSGTSFAAPRVVAALAREIAAGSTPEDAIEQVVDGPSLPRIPMLGTVVAAPPGGWSAA